MTPRNDETMSFEQWIESLRSSCARYNARRNDDRPFVGWVRPLALCGFKGIDVGCNASAVERTHRDIKYDREEHILIAQQLAGTADMMLDDQSVRAEPGDILLIDRSRPLQYRSRSGTCNLFSLELPRRSCIAHVGLQPTFGLRRPETLGARLLSHLLQSLRHEPMTHEGESDVDIIIYDLVRTLFGSPSWVRVSPHSDRLFQRVCRIAKRHFTNPDFGPAEIAAEGGISLRYLQKLFTSRGTTCSAYIQSLRLDHAFMLLARRAEGKRGRSVYEIAWESGYREPSYFHRVFRRRFGHSPGGVAGRTQSIFTAENESLPGA